ncbi:MAG: mechanosensitive ion channel family protein [Cryomorphaceae bacterium]
MENQLFEPLNQIKDQLIEKFPSIFWGLLSFVFFIFLGMFLSWLVKNRLKRRVEDLLLVNFVGRTILISFILLGIVFLLNSIGLGTAAGSLLAGAGVSAIILGFAFKDIGENFIAGFFLAFSRPFSTGDLIEVEGVKGTVRAMNFRTTHIRTFDGQDIFLPNAMLVKNPLSNYTRDGLLRHKFVLGIDYGDNIGKAMQIVIGALKKMEELEQGPGLEPFVMIENFGTSTVNLGIYYWINSDKQKRGVITLKNEAMSAGLAALTEAGFSLPADIVELKIYQEGQPIPLRMMD